MTHAPHVRNSQTSKAAAESLPNLNKMERLVLTVIRDQGAHGATDDELIRLFTGPYFAFNWAESTARARRVALMHKGLVVDSGKRRRTRPRGNRLGRWAVVWVVAEPELF